MLFIFITLAPTVQAAFTTLHNFDPYNSIGENPESSLIQVGNTLYGTTTQGGLYDDGTIFSISTNGLGYTTLFSFNGLDGYYPSASLILSGNTLYGTTSGGGPHAAGTAFSININGSDFTLLYGFNCCNPYNPASSLILSNNTLYGTAEYGGASDDGAIFSISTNGLGYTTLFNFNGLNGERPSASLILSGNTLYGTTYSGGLYGGGTVFSISTTGTGYTVLFSFNSLSGDDPSASLILSNNTLYGTTEYGGASDDGTVFSISTNGLVFNSIINFDNINGDNPYAALILSGNTLYGTTSYGGAHDYGTVFSISTNGLGYNSLFSFVGGSGGGDPQASPTLVGNTLYGTTYSGGLYDDGTIFSISTNGLGYNSILGFNYTDGDEPYASLILSGNTLYGTTFAGGAPGPGTIFSISTSSLRYTTIFSLDGFNGSGYYMYASPTLVGNTLYGTTRFGGASDDGTVFSVSTSGTGYTTLFSFNSADGDQPYSSLTLVGNTLYGTTTQGGLYDDGTIFSISTNGLGFNSIFSFNSVTGYQYQGQGSSLTLVGNTLYGTTLSGDTYPGGTIFSISTSGSEYTTLFSFNGDGSGDQPRSSLTLVGNTLYGTTSYGGLYSYGTIFSISTNGLGFDSIFDFNGTDGEYPESPPILSNNTLYGTTAQGGTYGMGTLYSYNVQPTLTFSVGNAIEQGTSDTATATAAIAGDTVQIEECEFVSSPCTPSTPVGSPGTNTTTNNIADLTVGNYIFDACDTTISSCSTSNTVIVTQAITAFISASPALPASLSVGDTETFTASASGGTGTYTTYNFLVYSGTESSTILCSNTTTSYYSGTVVGAVTFNYTMYGGGGGGGGSDISGNPGSEVTGNFNVPTGDTLTIYAGGGGGGAGGCGAGGGGGGAGWYGGGGGGSCSGGGGGSSAILENSNLVNYATGGAGGEGGGGYGGGGSNSGGSSGGGATTGSANVGGEGYGAGGDTNWGAGGGGGGYGGGGGGGGGGWENSGSNTQQSPIGGNGGTGGSGGTTLCPRGAEDGYGGAGGSNGANGTTGTEGGCLSGDVYIGGAGGTGGSTGSGGESSAYYGYETDTGSGGGDGGSVTLTWYQSGNPSCLLSLASGSTVLVGNYLTTNTVFNYLIPKSQAGKTLFANVTITDSSGYTANSAPTNILTVNALLSAYITPTNPRIFRGNSITLTAVPSGGQPPYSYRWYTGSTCNPADAIPLATSNTYMASPTSTSTFSFNVIDSATQNSMACATDTVSIVKYLIATPNPYTLTNQTIDVGQISIANTILSNGVATPYTGNWYWSAVNVSSGNTTTAALPISDNVLTLAINASSPDEVILTFNGTAYDIYPTGSNTIYGTWSFNAFASDANNDLSPMTALTNILTINPALSVSITPVNPAANSGNSATLTAVPSGGTPPYSYQWYIGSTCNPADAIPLATSNTYRAVSTLTTMYSVNVVDSASYNTMACANDTVNIRLLATPNPYAITNKTISIGQISIANTVISGGIGPYMGSWSWSMANVIAGNTTTADLPMSNNTLSLTIDAVSPYEALLAYNGVSYTINTSRNVVFESLQSLDNYLGGTNPQSSSLVRSGNTLYGLLTFGGIGNVGCGTLISINVNGTDLKTLHNFYDPTLGGDSLCQPYGSLTLSNNTLYGTTYSGGVYGYGTIFSINTDGYNFIILHNFTDNSNDGAYPEYGNLTLSGNTLYGMTYNGGAGDYGTIFSIKTNGSGFTLLHSFTDTAGDGAYPLGSLLMINGVLYGMTDGGGVNNDGIVFSITTGGAFTLLHSFTGSGSDGLGPYGSLINSGTTLYGTTSEGGTSGYGIIFSIKTNGNGFATLHDFPSDSSDGKYPDGSLTLSGNTLYGMTQEGGVSNEGIIFSITTGGANFKILHNFAGNCNNCTDGADPQGGALYLYNNTLYGMTVDGGEDGDIFSINTEGRNFVTLANFESAYYGATDPYGSLTAVGNTLYGFSSSGGASDNYGAIFETHTNTTGFGILASFNEYDGAYPSGSPTVSNGTIYGMASGGGAYGDGTIFSLSPGSSDITVLHSFNDNGIDGYDPQFGNLTVSGNTLYGMTEYGGTSNDGTIFSINTDGSGYKILKDFTGANGKNPLGSLTLSGNTLYGMTVGGGTLNDGTIFSINKNGSGFAILHNFTCSSSDGCQPFGSFAVSGDTLYGTTNWGGTVGAGIVFSIKTNGSDFTILHSFYSAADDYAYSANNTPTLYGNVLYGTTYWNDIGSGDGIVYSIDTDGSNFTTLHNFYSASDNYSYEPGNGPLAIVNGTLYGITSGGGNYGYGSIYSVRDLGPETIYGIWTFNASVGDSANELSPAPPLTNQLNVSPVAVTTTVPQNHGGGSGGSGGGAGAAGGGQYLPNVKITNSCAQITNFTQLAKVSFTLDGQQFDVVENYITPTSAGITIDGNAYTIVNSSEMSIGAIGGSNFTASLRGISYLPIIQTITLSICGPSTAAVTTTVLPTTTAKPIPIISNYSINVSNGRPGTFSFGNISITINTNATSLHSSHVSVTNVTLSTPPAPANFTKLFAYNVTVTSSTNLTIVLRYNCAYAHPSPFELVNGSWNMISAYTRNSAACTITFTIPSDPVFAVFNPINSTVVASTTITSSTTVSRTTTVQAKIPAYAYIVIVIVIIVAFVAYLYSRKRKRQNGYTKTAGMRHHN